MKPHPFMMVKVVRVLIDAEDSATAEALLREEVARGEWDTAFNAEQVRLAPDVNGHQIVVRGIGLAPGESSVVR